MAISITVPQEYPLVLGIVLIITTLCWSLGFLSGAKRVEIMTNKVTDNLKAEHEKAFPGAGGIQFGGYPDNGDGRYS